MSELPTKKRNLWIATIASSVLVAISIRANSIGLIILTVIAIIILTIFQIQAIKLTPQAGVTPSWRDTLPMLIFYFVELISLYAPSVVVMSGATCQPSQTCPVGLLIPLAAPAMALLGVPAFTIGSILKHQNVRHVFLTIGILHFLWIAPVMFIVFLL